jgi:hypothetical protein
MKRYIDAGASNGQWDEVCDNALDKRQFIDITTPATPDAEYSIEHGFGTPAIGFIVIGQDKAAVTYKSTTAWDNDKIYLKTNTASVAARIMVF